MKDSKQLSEAYRIVFEDDFFGFYGEVIVPRLKYDDAKEWLQDDVTESDFREMVEEYPKTKDAIIEELRDYMDFAWGKCEDERGISAGRSINKIAAWLMILDDDLWQELHKGDDFYPYGAPLLAKVCDKYGFDAPETIKFYKCGEWQNPYKQAAESA